MFMTGAYGVKRYFDNVDKAMERGYNTTLRSDKYGEMRFTRGMDSEEANSKKEEKADSPLRDDVQEIDMKTDQDT